MTVQADAAIGISLVNDIREIAGVAAQIDSFCVEREIPPEVAYSVNLALDELLSNTIAYGYSDEDSHRIEVIVRLEGKTLVIMIVDDGTEFDPTRIQEADMEASFDDQELGGLGLLLVNRMMDSVEYQRRAGCNVVVLTKDSSLVSSS